MMKCPKCGEELPDGAKYCPFCGPIEGEKINVEGGMKDSVAVRSPGAGSTYAPSISMSEEKKYCPFCENLITDQNHLLVCGKCGKKFCEHCEGFFRTERNRGERPFCEDCFTEMREKIRKEKDRMEGKSIESSKVLESYKELLEEVKGKKKALLLNDDDDVLEKLPNRNLSDSLKCKKEDVEKVIFDGIITQRLVDLASEIGVKKLIAPRIGNIPKLPNSIELLSEKDLN